MESGKRPSSIEEKIKSGFFSSRSLSKKEVDSFSLMVKTSTLWSHAALINGIINSCLSP